MAGVAEGPPNVPKRDDEGVSGTWPLNASGGSITVEGRKDGLRIPSLNASGGSITVEGRKDGTLGELN